MKTTAHRRRERERLSARANMEAVEFAHLTPGHPHFAVVAATVQHIGSVHSEAFPRTMIHEERSRYNCGRRRETSGVI